MHFGVSVFIGMQAVRLLQVMSFESIVAMLDELVGDWRVGHTLYVNSESNKLSLV
jgi:hypothetical protein